MHGLFRRALVVAAALVLVSGTAAGVAEAAPVPVLAFSPAPHDYQRVTVGQTAAQPFMLKNTGRSATSALTVTVAGSAAFSITADRCTGKSLGPGKSCTVTVQFAPTAGGGATATLKVVSYKPAATATHDLTACAATRRQIYWANAFDANEDLDSGTVNAANLDGSCPTALVSGQGLPGGVAVDGSHIYWTDQTDANRDPASGTIMQANLDGSDVTTLATGQADPAGVAVDSNNVYWANQYDSGGDTGDGMINEVPLSGGTPAALISGQDLVPNGVAVSPN